MHYLRALPSSHAHPALESGDSQLGSLERCLQSLSQICRIALPLPAYSSASTRLSAFHSSIPPVNMPTALRVTTLQTSLAAILTNEKIERLIWDPIAPYDQRVSAGEIYAIQEELLDWGSRHTQLFPDLNALIGLDPGNDWTTYPLPPARCPAISIHATIAAAHYNFYMGRSKWALCLLNEDPKTNEMTAYSYFYQAMRCTARHSEKPNTTMRVEDTYRSPEGLKAGFLPLLHIIGLCCPAPSWSDWIRSASSLLQQEGLFKGHTFATNLDCLNMFELHSNREMQTTSNRYPTPARRVICQLIPESDGRHYVSYFVRPRFSEDDAFGSPDRFLVLGHARWRCYLGEHPCSPDLHMYGKAICVSKLSEWLSSRSATVAWREWATHTEFSMERALQDHINGARLLPSAENVQQERAIL